MKGQCPISLIDNLCLLWHERQLSVFQINPAPQTSWITNIWFSLSWPFLLVICPLMDAEAELPDFSSPDTLSDPLRFNRRICI